MISIGKYRSVEEYIDAWANEEIDEVDQSLRPLLRQELWQLLREMKTLTSTMVHFILEQDLFDQDIETTEITDVDTIKGRWTESIIYKCPLEDGLYFATYSVGNEYHTEYIYEIEQVVKVEVTKYEWVPVENED